MKKIRAFSATEILVALAIVGILCVTMLSLNDMTDRNYKVATTKMLQVDNTLKTWGKAITKSNETGLGALQVVHDQASLEKSLKEYINIADLERDGIHMEAEYLTADANVNSGENTLNFDNLNSTIARINFTTEATAFGKKVPLSSTSVLTPEGVKNLDEVFEGWPEYIVESVVSEDGSTFTGYCAKSGGCGDANDADNAGDYTPIVATEGTKVYVKEDNVMACTGENENGSVITQSIGKEDLSIYTRTVNTCCPSPKIATTAGIDGASPVCVCPETFTPELGYKVDNSSATCQTACQDSTFRFLGRIELRYPYGEDR